MTVVSALNALAGTSGLEEQGAANALAVTNGLATVGALNSYLGTSGLEFQECLNRIAGTSGLGPDGAADAAVLKNLLTRNQSSVETDTTGLASRGAGFSIARSTAQAAHGAASVQVTNAASVTQDDWGLAVGTSSSDWPSVTDGRTYTWKVSVLTGAASGTVTLSMFWRNSGGSQVGLTKTTAAGTGAWQTITGSAVAATGAVYAHIVVSWSTGSGVYYVDQIGLWAGSSTIWVPGVD